MGYNYNRITPKNEGNVGSPWVRSVKILKSVGTCFVVPIFLEGLPVSAKKVLVFFGVYIHIKKTHTYIYNICIKIKLYMKKLYMLYVYITTPLLNQQIILEWDTLLFF